MIKKPHILITISKEIALLPHAAATDDLLASRDDHDPPAA